MAVISLCFTFVSGFESLHDHDKEQYHSGLIIYSISFVTTIEQVQLVSCSLGTLNRKLHVVTNMHVVREGCLVQSFVQYFSEFTGHFMALLRIGNSII